MVFRTRVIAPLALAWTLAAAGMAAVAFSTGLGATPEAILHDVQLGERDGQARIAFICSAPCTLEKRGDEYLLKAVEASFDFDLGGRSARLARVRAIPDAAGAVVEVTARTAIDRSSVKSCTVGGRPATCLDLFFADNAIVDAPEKTQTVATPAARETKTAAAAKPAGLREAAPERLNAFAGLAAPERFAPPAAAILAKVQPIEETIDVRKPSIRAEIPLATPARSDFAARVRAILGKELTPAFCNNAEATLQADAWALGAMVDVGLCAAARGDVAEADMLLARLLEFTPDNYQALVGRAIIAEQADEKGVARKYYQDALNALPPIEESNRIVNAMAALK